MAYWNRNAKVERPEWPKLVQIPGTIEEAKSLEPKLRAEDPDAEIVEGGRYGVFVRCHNPASVAVAQGFASRGRR